jgi:hypothetical protein
VTNSTSASNTRTESWTQIFLGPDSGSIISSQYLIRLNGSLWGMLVPAMYENVSVALIDDISLGLGLPKYFVSVLSLEIGSLVAVVQVSRNGTLAIPDGTIQAILSTKIYDATTALYRDVTGGQIGGYVLSVATVSSSWPCVRCVLIIVVVSLAVFLVGMSLLLWCIWRRCFTTKVGTKEITPAQVMMPMSPAELSHGSRSPYFATRWYERLFDSLSRDNESGDNLYIDAAQRRGRAPTTSPRPSLEPQGNQLPGETKSPRDTSRNCHLPPHSPHPAHEVYSIDIPPILTSPDQHCHEPFG